MPRIRRQAADDAAVTTVRGRLVLGRAEDCGLVLADESCSRQHAELVERDGAWWVRDLGSSNGTFVNGDRVEEKALNDGDHLRFGSVQFTYLASDYDFSLNFVAGESEGTRLPVEDERLTLGRRANNAMRFQDIKVSGVHLEIVREGDHHVLRDLGSTNGTWLEGRKIDEVVLSHGDRVKLGDQEFVFEDARAATVPAASDEALPAEAAAKTLVPTGGRRAGGLWIGVALVALLAGCAWFFFLRTPSRGEGGVVEVALKAPEGSTLTDDFSFEAAAAAGSWSWAAGTEALGIRAGLAKQGRRALSANLENDEVTVWQREPVAVRGGGAYRIEGALAAGPRARAGVSVVFLGPADAGNEEAEADADRRSEPRRLDVPALGLEASDGSFQVQERTVVAPRWAQSARLMVVGRGSGEVAVDDLAWFNADSPASTAVAELELIDRGGTFAVDHGVPLVELLQPAGSWEDGEGTVHRLPAAAFSVSINAQGTTLHVASGRFPPEFLLFQLETDTAASDPIVRTEQGSVAGAGSVESEASLGVVCGSVAERLELRFEPAQHLRASANEYGQQLRIVSGDGSWQLSVRAGFSDEQKQASELLVRARQDRRAGRLGMALKSVRTIQDDLPYFPSQVADARSLGSEVVRELENRRAALEAEADAAEFLDSLERYEQVLVRAGELFAALEGSPPETDLEARVGRIRERMSELRSQRHEAEAARLRRTADAFAEFEALDRSGTVEWLEEALRTTYGDTAAAGQGGGN